MKYTLCIGMTPAVQELREFKKLTLGEVNRSPAIHRSVAGKGANVARVLRQLGGKPLLLGFVGSEFITENLRREGVAEKLIRTKQPTRVCTTIMDHATGTITELVEEAGMPSASAWRQFFATLRRSLPQARFVVIAGALMPGASPEIYRRIAREAAGSRGDIVGRESLSFRVRADVRGRGGQPERQACPPYNSERTLALGGVPVIIDSQREPLLGVLEFKPFIAKLNVHELENTLGKVAIVAGARELIRRGAQNVIVTDGAKGAWLVNATGVWRYRPPRIKAVNPIGSGDAMTAGICRALERDAELTEAVRYGIACGAANALTLIAGTVLLPDVRRLMRQVGIDR